MYRVRMTPYKDSGFSKPLSGVVNLEVNQNLYVSMEVEGVDSRQISLVIEECWATPVTDPSFHVRWDLVISG